MGTIINIILLLAAAFIVGSVLAYFLKNSFGMKQDNTPAAAKPVQKIEVAKPAPAQADNVIELKPVAKKAAAPAKKAAAPKAKAAPAEKPKVEAKPAAKAPAKPAAKPAAKKAPAKKPAAKK